jgi:hypothetical protein
MIEKTYQDHLKILTSIDDGDDAVIEAIFENPTFARILKKLKYQIPEKLESMKPFSEFTPSGSASYEQKRSAGGQFEEIREACEFGFSLTDEFVGMVEERSSCRDNNFHKGTVVRSQYVRSGLDAWSDIALREREIPTDTRLKCIIQGILEPMKVRVISKGESIPYYSMKPIQKAMHGLMRRWDCFRLIGRPFCALDMVDLKVKASSSDEWFSIDYSAATDGLSYKYSVGILEEILERVDPHQYHRAMQVLGMHDLYYPDKHEVYGYDRVTSVHFGGTMSRGQLMGSILSFPILCLANLGLYLLVTQGVQEGWTDKERLRHVLINGDDMLYAAPRGLWERHVELGKKVGLNMSVGKAYHHREYANVNSTSVHYSLVRDELPHQIDFLNTGLLFGQHKVQGEVDGELSVKEEQSLAEQYPDHLLNERARYLLKNVREEPGIIASIGDLLKGALPGRQKVLLGEYLSLHSEKVERASMALFSYRDLRGKRKVTLLKRNLFLPCFLGGMGVKKPSGFRSATSKLEKKVAKHLMRDYQRSFFFSLERPIQGREVVSSDPIAPWVRPQAASEVRVIKTNHPNDCKVKAVPEALALIPFHPLRSEVEVGEWDYFFPLLSPLL